MWLAHVEKWPLLTFNRHGKYQKYDLSNVWDHEWDNPGPDARSDGLAFFNAGSDLIYTGPYPRVVFAIREIFKATREEEYLRFAEHVCQNILRQRFRPDSGLFTLDADHLACHLDCYEPLAMLTVAAAKRNRLDSIPNWDAGGSYQWSHNKILSGYSKKIGRPDVRPFVLRRDGENEERPQ